MNLNIFTIVYNGMPWIKHHYPMLITLPGWINWRWSIAEGPAANRNCTSWCRPQTANSSSDGTIDYLREITLADDRVDAGTKSLWNGKLEMCNWCLSQFTNRGVLMQIDSDELWTSESITKVVEMFRDDIFLTHARFYCRYFVGPNVVTVGENCYGNQLDEWARAWYFRPGDLFAKHEPPVFSANKIKSADKVETIKRGMMFDHMAYATREQVAYKENFYGYAGAVREWDRLQANTQWPVRRLKDFFPWVDERVGADLIK